MTHPNHKSKIFTLLSALLLGSLCLPTAAWSAEKLSPDRRWIRKLSKPSSRWEPASMR